MASWICTSCGYENPSDDRIGFSAPSCIRYKQQMKNPELLRKEIKKDVADLEKEIHNTNRKIWDLQDMIDSYHSEIGQMHADKINLIEICNSYKEQKEEIEGTSIITAAVRKIYPDQKTLIIS